MEWIREKLVNTEEIDQYWEQQNYKEEVNEEAERIYYETYPERVPEPAPVIIGHEASVTLLWVGVTMMVMMVLVGAAKAPRK